MLLLILTVLLFCLSTIRGTYQNHSLSAFFMFKEAVSIKSADCVLQLIKGIVMKCKVCQPQNRIAGGQSKKANLLTRTITPMDMNTHIM